jgi:hypothetical protein
LQYVKEDELAALIMALHRCAQRKLPITLVGAGLPQLRGRTGKAKSYAERLFDFPEVGALPAPAAKLAITKPARDQDVLFDDAVVDQILIETRGYPYFLQEWGNTRGMRLVLLQSPRQTCRRSLRSLPWTRVSFVFASIA